MASLETSTSSTGVSRALNHSSGGSAVAVGSIVSGVGEGVPWEGAVVGLVSATWPASGRGQPGEDEPADDQRHHDHGDRHRPSSTAWCDRHRREARPLRLWHRHTVHRGPYHGAMDLGLAGARALVGGGSRGLGGAIAETLAAEGAKVAIVSRPGPGLDAQAERLGGLAVPADLSTKDGPADAVAAAVDAWGGLDLLVINTGGPPPGRFEDLDEEAWLRAIDGTLLSTLRLLRAALPALRDGRDPAILIVLSSSVREPIPALTTSNLIRPGLAGLLKSLVDEIAPIRINGLAPGRLATGRIGQLDAARAAAAGVEVAEVQRQTIARIPLGRYGDPAELGRVGAFLLSPAASYVTGAIVPVDGGMVRALP